MSTDKLKAKLIPSPLPSPSPSTVQLPDSEHSDFSVPDELLKGTMMLKISEKKQKRVLFQLDPDEGRIIYKSSKIGVVALETVKEIRSGPAARYYREQFAFPPSAEELWLTVIYILEGTYKTLHILADTHEVFAMWDASVRKLLAIRQGLMTGLGNVQVRDAVWERQYWKGADMEGDNKLSFEEVEKLCWRLNATVSTPKLKTLFNDADTKKQGYLDFGAFQTFVKELKRRPEIEEIYHDLCKANDGKFDFPAFEKFMRDTQNTGLTSDALRTIFAKYAYSAATSPPASVKPEDTPPPTESFLELGVAAQPAAPADTTPAANEPLSIQAPSTQAIATTEHTTTAATAPETLTLDGFSSFLVSSDNAVFSEKDRDVWQDMTRPISEYYISSSHNTYLIGHQLVGVSTIEGYIRALLHSCRSVELDIYDGDTEPVVFHGKTFTSKVSLRDICHAIAKYAFVASPYPLLISAEVHCGLKQQDMLVEIMVEVFGEALIRAPVEGRPKISVLPSPEDLKGKFLLKAKNLYVVAQLEALRVKKATTAPAAKPQVLEADASSDSSSEDEDAGTNITGEIKSGLGELKQKWRRVRGKDSASTADSPPSSTAKPKVKMSFALASLLVYTVGVKCHGFGLDHGYAPEHIFSLSESAANKLLKGAGTMRELVKHTKGHMVRIYPKGTRVNSTNYEPHRYWAAGAQVVAINWQTFDLGYTMNQAMFQRNGRAGFVLKPEVLRSDNDELLTKRTKHVLRVTIISAHQLPRLRDSTGQEVVEKSIVDPLVQVSLHIPDWTHPPLLSASTAAASADTVNPTARTVVERTRPVRNNGFNPVWKQTLELPFEVVGGPGMRELVFVQFSVLEDDSDDDDDEPIAVYCTPLACLEQGYRHLPLHDSQLSQYLFSTLFVQVQIQDVE
ncbi:1-phosphatidylinositol-4,5-bisphosphate phosphodiesterase 1 [Lyophyllum atratum]|nr:1-phosphatidylinositol-4,5-bisphosphate phosphodiesterase 1 [Lyophyllum atratum]